MRLSWLSLIALGLWVVGGEASAAEREASSDAVIWSARGGELRLRFNEDLLRLYGVGLRLPKTPLDSREPSFALFPIVSTQALELRVKREGLSGLGGGSLEARGWLSFESAAGRVLLEPLRLRPVSGTKADLEIVDGRGVGLLRVAQPMIGIEEERARLAIHTADLVVLPRLARRLGVDALSGKTVGELRLRMPIVEGLAEEPLLAKCASPNFHGSPHPLGGTYRTDVLLESISWHVMRCRNASASGPCDGPGGDDGEVVFAPGAALRNGDAPRTADVPWYRKFTTSPHNYPYPGNDQHPYLIWNLYRIVDGRLEQIGASGLKHAFYTINWYCAPGACGAGGGNILGRACYDIYSQSSNDYGPELGPRRELIPFTGQWGRCGSIFDPGCMGSQTHPNPNGPYDNRLIVRESQLSVPGAQLLAEGWYVIQDDQDIYNTMGHVPVSIAFDGFSWSPTVSGPMVRGPVIDHWVDPTLHPNRNREITSPNGRVKVAVRVQALAVCPPASGLSPPCRRFDYAVQNLDFSISQTSGTPPNLRVLSQRGLRALRIDLEAALPVWIPPDAFADLDTHAANDWTATRDASGLVFSGPAGADLFWGTLYRFSFVSDQPLDDASLYPISLSEPVGGVTLTGLIAGPANMTRVFRDGFE